MHNRNEESTISIKPGQMIQFMNPFSSTHEVIDRGIIVEVDSDTESIMCLMNMMGRQVISWTNQHIKVYSD